MRNRRPAQFLLGSVALLTLLPGCQVLYSYRPIVIKARDAETKQPIADAEVRVSYPLVHPTQAPYDSVGKTGGDGVARLQATPFGPAGVLVEVRAKGYLFEQKTLPIESVEALERTNWFENLERRSANLVVDLYASPPPSVEFIVPVGYRGVIHADVVSKPDVPAAPGERCFRYTVPINGNVELNGPLLLARVAPLDYRAQYADGTPLGREPKGLELGFWAVKSEGNHLTFLVGTRAEFEVLRRAELQGSAPGRPTGGKGSGGGGGGRRGSKGGNTPVDPSTNAGQ
jgi:hypothetical protein